MSPSMSVVLRLDGPLQSWGSSSMFERRGTDPWPTKSGVVGVVSAACGIPRGGDMGFIAACEFAVRVDQPGRPVDDYHVAGTQGWLNADGKVTRGVAKLSTRTYLADAVFVAALSGDDDIIDRLVAALRCPVYHSYLGRRSCPPAAPILIGTVPGGPAEALAAVPYQGHGLPVPTRLRLLVDDPDGVSVADQPVSTVSLDRQFAQRRVASRWIPTVEAGNRIDDDDPYGIRGSG